MSDARWIALGLALSMLALPPLLTRSAGRRAVMAACPALAAILSAIYIIVYLRGGPRIIDATAYWLQAKALSEGMLQIPLPDGVPEQAIAGRFLLLAPTADAVSVIFPPGYPALLALGFVVGAPLAVGPALAAALVIATMELTRALCRVLALEPTRRDSLVAVAGLLSASCAALRYHTADTMSHGAAALWLTIAVTSALHPKDPSRGRALLVGVATSMLFCTRPASALALGAALAALFWMKRWPLSALAWAALGALPPLALWLAHQQAATGSVWSLAQSAYYAISDGPPGCFRYGFGEGIGCLGEHGDFVRHNLPDGYGAWAALGTTGRRLMLHVSDAMGLWPLSALWLLGAWHLRSTRGGAVAALIPLIVAAYAPFYFDGNYPGGGARMFIDVVPVEHALAAVGLHAVAGTRSRVSLPWAAALTLALGLLGFSFHLGERHEQLRDREHGQPMFDAHSADIDTGVVWVDTDHGFNLALAWSLGDHRRLAARYKGDDLDALTLRAAGLGPHGHRYLFPGHTLSRHAPDAGDLLDIEGASLWPPRTVSGGFAWPSYVPLACASGGRVLALYPVSGAVTATLALPRGGTVRIWLANLEDHVVDISIGNNSINNVITASACTPLAPVEIPEGDSAAQVVIRASGAIGVDRLELRLNR